MGVKHFYKKLETYIVKLEPTVQQQIQKMFESTTWYLLRQGKKFEIQPDGLPSARKLVYYTGSAFRSQHLLQLLSNSHRLYLNIQPVQKQIRKLEEKEEKKCYREFYISDNMEMDLDQSDMYSHGSSQGSAKQNRLSRQSTVSHSSSHTSGIEADSHYSMSVEMSVDEPFGIQRGQEKLFCSVNHSNSGIDGGSKETIQRGSQDYGKEVELSVDNPHQVPVIDTLRTNTLFMETEEVSVDFPTLDYHCWQVMKQRGQSVDSLVKTKPQNLSDHYSQSLDDVRFNQQNHPQFTASALTPDTSQSYTFGSATEDKMMDFCATYTTADCRAKSGLYGKLPMNCLSLDRLDEGQLLEYIL